MLSTSDHAKWLPVTPDMDASLRLFCIPFAGGGVSMFRGWQEHLPHNVQLCPIALPGREKRLAEKSITDLAELTDMLCALLTPYADKPFILFGHCFGGCLAFETARKLHGQGASPTVLAVSGCRAPHIAPPLKIADLPPDSFTEALRRFRLTPETVLDIPDLLALFIPTLRADFKMDETYRYTGSLPVFDFPVAVMFGEEDAIIPQECITPWQGYAHAPVTLTPFKGGHVFFADNPGPMLHAIFKPLDDTVKR
ncbi:MAG: hypothetical protein BCS36_06610 [Desulfovibrio sp. MES5]|uniref:thioesterase II family protein n=1 Tax=Desulfovibrio sp. MES5 TaxID=1899016 RepID=UPI000B9CDDF3|nr:alpha/beta fold hydrolase [Desulfovibrio sp. MES5]OXS30140.1 MAG: hypothetical protein BCS36_06610 [Desulfovibrio sp. MES5]